MATIKETADLSAKVLLSRQEVELISELIIEYQDGNSEEYVAEQIGNLFKSLSSLGDSLRGLDESLGCEDVRNAFYASNAEPVEFGGHCGGYWASVILGIGCDCYGAARMAIQYGGLSPDPRDPIDEDGDCFFREFVDTEVAGNATVIAETVRQIALEDSDYVSAAYHLEKEFHRAIGNRGGDKGDTNGDNSQNNSAKKPPPEVMNCIRFINKQNSLIKAGRMPKASRKKLISEHLGCDIESREVARMHRQLKPDRYGSFLN